MKGLTGTGIVALVLFALCWVAVAESGDWTAWRGPDGNGISKENAWNPKAVERASSVLWSTNVGAGHSTVAVKDSLLYTMGDRQTAGGAAGTYEEVVYCLDALSGR
jgi:hypothetical protein